MEIILKKDDLIRPLSLLNTIATDKNPAFQAIGFILFNINNYEMTMLSTDIEMDIEIKIPFTQNLAAKFALPSRKFFDFIKNSPDGSEIKLFLEEGKSIVSRGRSRLTLLTFPVNDFPVNNEKSVIYRFTIGSFKVIDLIDNTFFSMATKDVRFYLNGMLFELTNDKVKTVCTDGHRLAYYEVDNDNIGLNLKDTSKFQFILPRRSIMEIRKLLSQEDIEVNIEISNNFVTFEYGNIKLSTKLINAKYPEYSRVIPHKNNLCKTVIFNKDELINALRRVNILTTDLFNTLRFNVSKNQLVLTSHNAQHEEASESLIIPYDGDDFTVGFNITYLLDCLTHIEDNEFEMSFAGENNDACVIKYNSLEYPIFVLMPLHL